MSSWERLTPSFDYTAEIRIWFSMAAYHARNQCFPVVAAPMRLLQFQSSSTHLFQFLVRPEQERSCYL